MTLSTYLNRANAAFSFFSSVFFGVLAVVAVTGPALLYTAAPPTAAVNMAKASVKMGRLGYYYDQKKPMTEIATVHFDLNADLSPLFNWNTKQLFVQLVAEYKTESHNTNQVTIWDDIITSKEDAIIKIKKKKGKYVLSDITGKIAGQEANLTLHWDLMPYVGLLIHDKTDGKRIRLPSVEEKKKK